MTFDQIEKFVKEFTKEKIILTNPANLEKDQGRLIPSTIIKHFPDKWRALETWIDTNKHIIIDFVVKRGTSDDPDNWAEYFIFESYGRIKMDDILPHLYKGKVGLKRDQETSIWLSDTIKWQRKSGGGKYEKGPNKGKRKTAHSSLLTRMGDPELKELLNKNKIKMLKCNK